MARTFNIVSGDLDETFFTPLRAPGVLDQPEVVSIFAAVANGQHTVVDLIAAFIVEDTTSVELELVVHGNSHGNGLIVQSSFHLLRRVLRNVSETGHGESGVVTAALAITASVRVIRFGGNAVFRHVGESVVHQTAVAAHVSVLGAVDQSLFRELHEVASFDGVKTFQSANGGESPAGTALSLVLDVSNGTFLDPVDGFGLAFVAQDILNVAGLSLNVAGFEGGEFFEGEIHVLVLAESVGEVLGVMLINHSEVFFENFESCVFFGSSVFLIVLLLPNLEFGQKRVLSELGLGVRVLGVEIKASSRQTKGQKQS